VHSAFVAAGIAFVAFAGTMVDNFVALTAQLALTDRRRHDHVGLAHFLGVVVLVAMSALVASALASVPLGWVGLLAIAPAALGVHAWRTRDRPARNVKRGMVTTFVVTVALGGDNLAVWIPILRAGGYSDGAITIGVFLVSDAVMVFVARAAARHPKVVELGGRIAPIATPFLYFALAIVILWECGWI
jgi:cadmium resistance protein CadD (predicted permease)